MLQVQISTLPLSALVAIHNILLDKSLKSFRDRATAVSRVQATLDSQGKVLVEAKDANKFGVIAVPASMLNGSSPGMARLQASADAEAIRQKVVADQKTAADSVARAPQTGSADKARDGATPVNEAKTPDVAPAKKGGRPSQFADNAVVVVLAEANPRRGDAAARFSTIKSGVTTVANLVAGCGRKRAMRDLRRGVRSGHLSVG